MRLDEYLVKHKKVSSRNRASTLVKRGLVLVNQQKNLKCHQEISANDVVDIMDDDNYVSRAAYKLLAGLNEFKIHVSDKVVLDIGASTGGFSDVCLRGNAKLIYCIDVGKKQLDPQIANNPRIINYEQLNIKNLKQSQIKHQIDLVVSDLSFISSKYMFAAISKLALSDHVDIITLIKPQFELNFPILSKHQGVVKENKYHQLAITKVSEYAKQYHFKVIKIIESPILGAKKGNKEFLMWAQHE